MQLLIKCLHLLDTAPGTGHTAYSETEKLPVLVKLSKQLKYRVFSAVREAVQWRYITEIHPLQQSQEKFFRKKR